LKKLKSEPVIETLQAQGSKVLLGTQALIDKHRCSSFLSVSGNPAWSFLIIGDASPYTAIELKTLFMQEMFARGILTFGTHNMSYAHGDQEVEALLSAYDAAFPMLREAIASSTLPEMLRCEPLKPLFKVR